MTIAAVASAVADRVDNARPVLSALAEASLQKTKGAPSASGTPPTITHPLLASGLDHLDYHVQQVLRDHQANHAASTTGTDTSDATSSDTTAQDASVRLPHISLPDAQRPLVAAAEQNLKYHLQQVAASHEANHAAPTASGAAASVSSVA